MRALSAPLYLDLLHGTFTHFPPQALEKYGADWTAEIIAERAAAGRFALYGAFDINGEAVGLLFGAPEDSGVGTIIWLGVAESEAPHRYRREADAGGVR